MNNINVNKSLILIDDSNFYYGFKKYHWESANKTIFIEDIRKEVEKKKELP